MIYRIIFNLEYRTTRRENVIRTSRSFQSLQHLQGTLQRFQNIQNEQPSSSVGCTQTSQSGGCGFEPAIKPIKFNKVGVSVKSDTHPVSFIEVAPDRVQELQHFEVASFKSPIHGSSFTLYMKKRILYNDQYGGPKGSPIASTYKHVQAWLHIHACTCQLLIIYLQACTSMDMYDISMLVNSKHVQAWLHIHACTCQLLIIYLQAWICTTYPCLYVLALNSLYLQAWICTTYPCLYMLALNYLFTNMYKHACTTYPCL